MVHTVEPDPATYEENESFRTLNSIMDADDVKDPLPLLQENVDTEGLNRKLL